MALSFTKSRSNRAVFRYKPGNSFIYRIPAGFKLLSLLGFTVAMMYVPLRFIWLGIPIIALLAFLQGFGYIDQKTDLKPALYYTGLLYLINIFANIFNSGLKHLEITKTFTPDKYYMLLALRLVVVMQASALLFRSTTSVEIKDTLCEAETAVRHAISRIPFCRSLSFVPRVTFVLALAVNFIPEIFETWNGLERAARARGCKAGVRKTLVLLPQLISLSLRKAVQKIMVLESRTAS